MIERATSLAMPVGLGLKLVAGRGARWRGTRWRGTRWRGTR
jgi:hypothetical protein